MLICPFLGRTNHILLIYLARTWFVFASSPTEDVSMKIRKLDHAALLVKDVERSRHFYGQVLGMQEIPRPSNFDFPGAWFRQEGAEVHIIGEAEPGRAAQVQPGYRRDEMTRGYGAHIAFQVDDLEEAR